MISTLSQLKILLAYQERSLVQLFSWIIMLLYNFNLVQYIAGLYKVVTELVSYAFVA
jgi:hypothetical protein